MQWFKTILFFLYYFNQLSPQNITGHDGCKGEEWVGLIQLHVVEEKEFVIIQF